MITYNITDNITIELTPDERRVIENAIAASVPLSATRDAIEKKFEDAVEKRAASNERMREETQCAEERKKVSREPKVFELHVSPYIEDFPRRFGRKLRVIGGKYTHCRGYATNRFVDIPNTDKGRVVADEILASDKKACTVVARGLSGASLPAWVSVHKAKTIEEFLGKLSRAIDSAVKRGILEPTQVCAS